MKYTIIERLTKIGKRLLNGADKSEVKADSFRGTGTRSTSAT